MEKRKLVLTIIGVVILAMVIMYISTFQNPAGMKRRINKQ